MNKKITLSMFLILFLFLSIGSIHASDTNITDFAAIDSTDDSLQITQENHINSENMSINTDDILSDNKNKTEMSSSSSKVYQGGSYSVILKDSNANEVLANKTVNFVINNVNYSTTTNSKGIASVNLALDVGKYSAAAYFDGDSSYDSSNFTSDFNVLSTIKASDLTKYYKGSKQYSATFYDSLGNLLKNKMVTITVKGKSYSKKTNSKGVATLDINLKPGTYKITSTNPATGYKLTTNIKILSTISASDLKKVKGDSNKFKVKFYKSNGKALAKKYVKIKIKGKSYWYKTSSSGYVRLTLNNFKNGVFKVVSYNNDGTSKTNTVTIYRIANTKLYANGYTFAPGDNRQIKVKLTTSLGGSSVSGKIIKITIGGKTYSKKTGASGIVYMDLSSISKGLYNVKYQFVGNKFFKSSSDSKYITILDTNATKLAVKGTTRFGYGAHSSMNVVYTAGGVPLRGMAVKVTVEGTTYSGTTNNNGVVSVPIDLGVGNYTVSFTASGNDKVCGTSDSAKIEVFERSEAKLTWKSGTSFKDSLQKFKVLLTDKNGNPISGQTVELDIGDYVYSAKTASNGYATIKVYASMGNYKVEVKALGDNNFLPSSTSKSIKITVSKFKNGLNEKASGSYSSSYLKSSKNCPVNNAKIKALVKSVTSGLTDPVDKAKAIFNYVRDTIAYDYYYNSHRGAIGTLRYGRANCVDQAHLLISMYRTAGFMARYVHGSCRFSDGVYGHVWTQVLIGNTWVVGDPINSNNELGKINNWNANTFVLKNRYVSLPF